jgi:hypothetical protein
VISNGGLILIRELDERLGLKKLIEEYLSDSRFCKAKTASAIEKRSHENISL